MLLSFSGKFPDFLIFRGFFRIFNFSGNFSGFLEQNMLFSPNFSEIFSGKSIFRKLLCLGKFDLFCFRAKSLIVFLFSFSSFFLSFFPFFFSLFLLLKREKKEKKKLPTSPLKREKRRRKTVFLLLLFF